MIWDRNPFMKSLSFYSRINFKHLSSDDSAKFFSWKCRFVRKSWRLQKNDFFIPFRIAKTQLFLYFSFFFLTWLFEHVIALSMIVSTKYLIGVDETGLLYLPVWQYRLWSFQGRDKKLERFLAKNQIT